jgi:uncharacterized protein YbaR (Trm112 family)
MKKELTYILACPACKDSLELKVTEENEQEVITGSLSCIRCGAVYPVQEAIPELLPPDRRNTREVH